MTVSEAVINEDRHPLPTLSYYRTHVLICQVGKTEAGARHVFTCCLVWGPQRRVRGN